MSDLKEFHQELIADIQGDADVLGLVTVEAFFEKTADLLAEAGEIEQANRGYFEGSYGRGSLQVDGYGGDPRDTDGILSLILCDFALTDEVRVLNKEHMQRLLQKLYRFLSACLQVDFREQLEETSSGFGIADLVATTWRHVKKVKLIIVTNADFRARADAANVTEHKGVPVTLSVWDLKRLRQFLEQGQARASLEINFEKDFDGSIPLLKASNSEATLENYLAIIPGRQLAAIYDKWGPRLLEANVRSFLQARGKVNRGIRDTIRDDPNMFFSYNNGLSATAEEIDVKVTSSGLKLVSANNLQIVNGGQTTASLHAASKTFSEALESVQVQMKLTIVPKEKSEAVVPKISEFANSQNKVNAADFFANHPFHIRVEELSRRILAPASVDGYRETKWFYERARGQYADERGRRTPAERRKFDSEFPRAQLIAKIDLAKYENTWSGLPHIVSLGAQKNFTEFAKGMEKRWGKDGAAVTDVWYKRMIAKAIIFKRTEKLVSNANWYEGDCRANIVTYAIAKLVHDAELQNMVVDLDAIWRRQEISYDLSAALSMSGHEAQKVILNPYEGMKNPREWAKKQPCWKRLSEAEIVYPDEFENILIPTELADETVRESKLENAVENSAQAQIDVFNLGADFWKEARDWARERGILGPMEMGVIEVCAAMPQKIPSDKQCAIATVAIRKLKNEGFKCAMNDFG